MQHSARDHRAEKLFGWFVFLGPPGAAEEARLEAAAYEFAKANETTGLAVAALGDPQGPPGYRIAPDAEVTVVLFRNRKIIAKMAFTRAEWNASAADSVMRQLPKLLAAR